MTYIFWTICYGIVYICLAIVIAAFFFQEEGVPLMQGRTTVLLLAILVILHVLLLGKTSIEKKTLPSDAGGGFILPSPVLKITSFEFKGIVSDLLFIKAMVFRGARTSARNSRA